jgi:hypothetical protein
MERTSRVSTQVDSLDMATIVGGTEGPRAFPVLVKKQYCQDPRQTMAQNSPQGTRQDNR